MSPVVADCEPQNLYHQNYRLQYILALSQAPPPAVIETATNKLVIITPSNIAPKDAKALPCLQFEKLKDITLQEIKLVTMTVLSFL